ncbi:MAG: hypothetical protein V4667_01565 [Bacteroidota bacterium]
MKTGKLIIAIVLFIASNSAFAQQETKSSTSEKYGSTLNAGLGIGYYGYIGQTTPVLHLNYEFDVAKNFTLAPFITYYSYKKYNYWGDPKYTYKNYYYRQTVIPIGVKGTYYFDEILGAGSNWDFYLAGSLGVAIRKTTWENGYYGNTTVYKGNSGLYLDGHIGTEYHLNNKVGLFLDLASGLSTFGLAIHL